ncbi:hypothetical protein Fmac_025317 [Flemingia macrophylla]|uniref:Disease resistance RPP13-like protein 1 n=1 Tax=Flemingia macrophylla TaxID=520843 RepID=A0ABD1LRW3_9FABA
MFIPVVTINSSPSTLTPIHFTLLINLHFQFSQLFLLDSATYLPTMPVIETLGGAFFGAVLQVLFDRLASRQVLDYFRGRKLDEKLLRKLKLQLSSIHAVIDDAEQKQFNNSSVKPWLEELRDTVLDAEDLLDEIDYESCKWEMEAESYSKVCNFDNRIESNMNDLLEQLEDLLNQKDHLGLKNAIGVGVESISGSKVTQKLPSTSSVIERDIYGRNNDKDTIFNWLTSDTVNHNQLSILSVVGMGGMGKTTLVQHVFNDPSLDQAEFKIKAWVCVSDEFDVFTLTRAILEASTGSTDDSRNLEMIQRRLKEKLTGRRFLLVLDDVWNESRDEWETLQTPLNCGAQGSIVLVTTRSSRVASIMQSYKTHHLKQLQENDSWQVFDEHAFQDDNCLSKDELKEIGIKIVQKCKGLPLALKTIGCLLRTKSSVSEWHSVLISKIWDFSKEDSKIIPALLLSYYHLPSHLKRCFAYSALFPKDHEFDKESLILLWMGENFLQCSQHGKRLEEIGEQYFNDLLSRSFFQQSSGDKKRFVMHDLHNDLAKYVCGDMCFRLGVEKHESIQKTRHFSFVAKYEQCFDGFGSLYEAKRLRTFIPTSFDRRWFCKMPIHELIFNFTFLRVLSFSGCCDLQEVPDSIGNFKHLRSLDLSRTAITKLPDSTCSLYKLQILKLNYCGMLEELPLNLHKLMNLRHLELVKTRVRKMPMHLETLKNLQVLNSFYVDKDSDFSIQQLGKLDLHGSLSIEQVQNIVNPSDALVADLKNKSHLVKLKLKWQSDRNIETSMKDREVLENLQPSKHLLEISIWNYGGTQFPNWLFNNSLSKIVYLNLKHCKYSIRLPPLGILPFLKDLKIIGLDGIVVIDADFYGSSTCSFVSLKSLYFYGLKEWEDWECVGVTGSFPCLEYLKIKRCPKFIGHLPEQLHHLKSLEIIACEELVAFVPIALSLESLYIYDCPNMSIRMNSCFNFLQMLCINAGCDSLSTISLDFFPKLTSLFLIRCRTLQVILQGHTHNHLKYLTIKECPQFESFPSEGLPAPNLETFEIRELENLISFPGGMDILLPCLTTMHIWGCPQLELFSNGGIPSSVKWMAITYRSKHLTSLKGALGPNPSPVRLSVRGVDAESFPDEGLLPPSLTALEIRHSPDLKRLDYKGLCHLSSLKLLHLNDCSSLQCLPEEGLPKSISSLYLWNCPMLKLSCLEGDDRAKIAHLEHLWYR